MFKLLTTALAVFSAALPASAAPAAAPAPVPQTSSTGSSLSYWLAQTSFHKNTPIPGNPSSTYQLFRNVKDAAYGAVGDGSTDDTAAIQKALDDGGSCALGCNSSTIYPKLVYFPPGKYVVSKPIQMPYYTQLVGDATDLPWIVAASSFTGMALLDSDPYTNTGANWFINQNNFFRQVRNFNIDVRPAGNGMTGAGIHWQVAQATSLQNINFWMSTAAGTAQQGIFMDNGSGGWMSDLTFNGGLYGAFFGNQQFTSRNMTFVNCQTAIFMNSNWGWTLADITIQGPGGNATGINMANSPSSQTVGSLVLADSSITGVQRGIVSAFQKSGNVPAAGGSLIIDNVKIDAAGGAVVSADDQTILASSSATIRHWVSGNVYDNSADKTVTQGPITIPSKSPALLNGANVYGRSKPQCETVAATGFLSALTDGGCKGDGVTDDTDCVQSFLNEAQSQNKIAYFDHAVYRHTKTVTVPAGSRIVGETWSVILATNFTNSANPTPVWQLGASGSSGTMEISDILFLNQGPNPGAIMVQWNLNCKNKGDCGMWDTHVRIGGSYGTNQQLSTCAKQPGTDPTGTALTNCMGVYAMFYAPATANNVYLENTWFWVADHDFEDPLNQQISIYSARGVLTKAATAWLWGTSSEHSIIYNFQFDGVQALFAGFIQTETPYMQPFPLAPKPFTANTAQPWRDPDFSICTSTSTDSPCQDSWGLRMIDSNDVLIYSLGMYSFFNGYLQDCLLKGTCQQNMIRIQSSVATMYAATTIGTVNMVRDSPSNGSMRSISASQNADVYGDTMAVYITGTS